MGHTMPMLRHENYARFDWATTPLGPIDGWSRQLRSMCDFLLCSKQPMFMFWGPQYVFLFNTAYQDIWGIDQRAALGRPIAEIASENWKSLAPMIQKVFQGEAFALTDICFDVPGQSRRYFDHSYTPVYDYEQATEKIVGAFCVCNDVTARRIAAEQISESREALALAVENVTEGIALVDSDLALILWNEPFRIHFGYGEDQVASGVSAIDLMLQTARRGDLGSGDPEAIVGALVHSILTTESAALEIQRANGHVLSLLRRTLSGGRYLLISRDITEERTASRLKDELVSTVSHELRTPLTAISGALGIVSAGAAGELTDKADRLVKIAQRNSERLVTLVNDLLDIDKMQSGKSDFQFDRENLAELVTIGIEQNLPYAEHGGVQLCADVPAEPVPVTVDRNRILQVLTNLISNAVKFSPSGGEVVVQLRVADNTAHISVIDNGIGISADFRSRLFQRFTQYDASSSRVQQGTGLGLAICKSIVEQHGGTIWLDEKVEKGATFHVDLPLTT